MANVLMILKVSDVIFCLLAILGIFTGDQGNFGAKKLKSLLKFRGFIGDIGAKGHAVYIFFTGATARYVWVNNAMAWDQARLTCISTGKIFKLL
jgi:hypothetical protein